MLISSGRTKAVPSTCTEAVRSIASMATKSSLIGTKFTIERQTTIDSTKSNFICIANVLTNSTRSRSMNIHKQSWSIGQQRRTIFIIAEGTPNPESVMFYPQGREVLGAGAKTKTYGNKHDGSVKSSLLAGSLFKIHGVQSVMLAARHITITKTPEMDWELLQPNVELVVSQFYSAGLEVIDPKDIEYYEQAQPRNSEDANENLSEEELIKGIINLLEERVQPFVQQDGGDVAFEKFDPETKTLWLRMMGACAGCPKSNQTLHVQIKSLVTHYFPQVEEVGEWIDPNEEVIPRGH